MNGLFNMLFFAHSHAIKGGKEILEAKYLQKIGFIQQTEMSVVIKALCIQVSKPGSDPHEIEVGISKPFPGQILLSQCSCVGGSNGKCKHATAMLLQLCK